MEIDHHLRRTRESKRMSQQEVSDALGISQKTLSNIESSKSQPSILLLAKLGEIYELDVLGLLSDYGVHFYPYPTNRTVK